MPLNSIRSRLTFIFSMVSAILLLISCSGMIAFERRISENRATMLLNSTAHKMQRMLPNGISSSEMDELVSNERDLTGETLALVTYDQRGQLIQKSQNVVPDWPNVNRTQWRVLAAPGDRELILIALPWQRTHDALRMHALILIGLVIFIEITAAAGAWILVGRTLSPIRELAQQARVASVEKMKVQFDPSSQDAEIIELVATLNSLLARLTEVTASHGRFYADASHELRTPLQALSGHLELALTRPRSNEGYREVIQEAHSQTLRLTHLIYDLLTLNRLESAQPLPKESQIIEQFCSTALRQCRSLAAEKQLQIEFDANEVHVVLAAQSHIEMLVRNLVENAIKYAQPGGLVRVRCENERLEVFNECPQLAEWQPEKLFEPFYRPDASRDSKTGGNGLGLAICKAIIDLNNWEIILKQTSGGVLAAVDFTVDPPITGIY